MPKASALIYLLRHGHTALDTENRSDGWLDLPLSDEGQLELIESQQALKTTPIAKIYTPDLKRTRETAQLMRSGLLSQPPVIVNDRAKTWNLGVLAGTKKRYGRPEVQKLIADPESVPLGGESYKDFCSRFLPWFEARCDEAEPENPILIVCSGSNLRLIADKLLGDGDALDLDEGGLAILHKEGDTWTGEIVPVSLKNAVSRAVDARYS